VEIQLISISPIAFSVVKIGDIGVVQRKRPRAGEFRGDKIGGGTTSYLIFKGVTKIGMLPVDVVQKIGESAIKRRCRIKSVDEGKGLIIIEF
jgi:hypothetical protein